MPAFPSEIGSMSILGLPKFVIEPQAVYLSMAEQAIIENPEIAISMPPGANFYAVKPPGWMRSLVAEGVLWTPAERRVLEFLLALIPEFDPELQDDASFRLLSEGSVPVVPFAYPIIFQPKDGRPSTAAGLWFKAMRRIFILRSELIARPLSTLLTAYHEGWHAVANDGDEEHPAEVEIAPHTKQLALCQCALRWLEQKRPKGTIEERARDDNLRDLAAMQESVEAVLIRLRGG